MTWFLDYLRRRFFQCADFGSENKVTFCQPVNLVCPDPHGYKAPGQSDFRVVVFILGDFSNGIGKGQSLFEAANHFLSVLRNVSGVNETIACIHLLKFGVSATQGDSYLYFDLSSSF